MKVSYKASWWIPLIIDIDEKNINFIMYLFEKDENSIVNQALLVSINVHSNGNTNKCS